MFVKQIMTRFPSILSLTNGFLHLYAFFFVPISIKGILCKWITSHKTANSFVNNILYHDFAPFLLSMLDNNFHKTLPREELIIDLNI